MARREDYLLARSLLTDGTITQAQLSNILLKWHQGSPKSLLEMTIDERLISEEEGRGLMMFVEKLAVKGESKENLSQLDFIICQIAIKKDIASPELVSSYRREGSENNENELSEKTEVGRTPTSEALLKDGHIPGNAFIELKRSGEQIFYHRKIVALARGKERLANTFRSPGREEGEENTGASGRLRPGIQKAVNDFRAESHTKPKPSRRRTSALPRVFGKYEVIEEIARGGMGTVYKARQVDLNKIVALKVLHEEDDSPDRVKRFRRESDAASLLKHPNIVGIHESGEAGDRHYFSMDYIDGVPLSVLMQKTKNVELEDLLNIAAELARAVHYAHKQSIIHRDLKPANIIIDMEGHPQITDFGLAKILDTRSRLTKSDTIIGTPFYMAPEQTRGDNHLITPRTDVWGMGIILYEMVTKKLPFVGRSSIELYHKINNQEPVPPGKIVPQLPRELDYIVLKAIAKDPQDRYASAEAMADDIEKYLDGQEVVMKEAPLWLRRLRRFFRRHKGFLLVAILAILLGWFCGWYIMNKFNLH